MNFYNITKNNNYEIISFVFFLQYENCIKNDVKYSYDLNVSIYYKTFHKIDFCYLVKIKTFIWFTK